MDEYLNVVPTKMVLWSVRFYYRVLDFFNSLCYTNQPVEYDQRWMLCSPTLEARYFSETREALSSDLEYPILIHEVVRNDGTVRMAVHHNCASRDPYSVENLFERPTAPWLFIGYKINEETIDCTDVMSDFVCEGNRITQEVLDSLFPYARGNQWVYIHPKTFENTTFPSEGILIKGYEPVAGDEQSDGRDKKND